MKLKINILVALLLLVFVAKARTVTDMAGRTVNLPEKVARIIPYDPKTSVLLFTCCEDKMVAKGAVPGQKHYNYLSDRYTAIPDVDTKNMESLLSFSPDLLVVGIHLPASDFGTYDKLQQRLKIPVVIIDLSLEKLDQTYLFLGKLLGNEAGFKPYADYLTGIYAELRSFMAKKETLKASVYYTLGVDGLMTDPAGSIHTEVFDFLKIPNAAKVEIPTGGHAKVDLEQVLIWNPDYIFAADFKGEKNPYQTITTNSRWAGIKAVKEHHVYKVPSEPFSWFDHPPTINRVCGLIWLAEIFYNYPKEKARTQIEQFYKLFYGYELSNSEYANLFQQKTP
jgi:iron complex transport system substrate-binding protein